jgi:hypothetical protein
MNEYGFLTKDPVIAKQEITDALYARLKDTRREMEKIALNGFDAGINCRCENEVQWLLNLLDTIERS